MYLKFLVFLEEKTKYEECACFYENTFSESPLIISMRLPDSVIGGFSIFSSFHPSLHGGKITPFFAHVMHGLQN
jgi:hypothetical protein